MLALFARTLVLTQYKYRILFSLLILLYVESLSPILRELLQNTLIEGVIILSAVPSVDYAIIGGSSTYSFDFPQDLDYPDLTILERDLVFSTPYGDSPPFILFSIGEERVLTCKMHGWRRWQANVSRAKASRQIFHVFGEAKVKKVLSEGGVGAINHLLEPRDLIVPHDYIDFSNRRDVDLNKGYLLMMRKALCPSLRRILFEKAEEISQRVFQRGIYMVTDGRHFESPAEIQFFKPHADIVGQSLAPEVYLSREIGACYAGIYLVVNYAEGIVEDWEHELLEDIFYGDEGRELGHILLYAVKELIEGPEEECDCLSFRHPTMLR